MLLRRLGGIEVKVTHGAKTEPYLRMVMTVAVLNGRRLTTVDHNNRNKCSAVAEMGDRLVTINMCRKLNGGSVLLFGELDPHATQFALGRGLSSYQVAY